MGAFENVVSSIEELRRIVPPPAPGARTLLKERTCWTRIAVRSMHRSPITPDVAAKPSGERGRA